MLDRCAAEHGQRQGLTMDPETIENKQPIKIWSQKLKLLPIIKWL